MNVLMVTPTVHETHRLGFIVGWIRALAKRVDRLYVITLAFNPDTPLPENTTVYGLNERSNKLTKYFYFSRIVAGLLFRKQVDVIFCHMSPTFVIMAAPWAKLFRIPIVQWYAHGAVSWRLRLASFLASKVVTSSKEGFRIRSDKVVVTGQGIDTDRFSPGLGQKREGNKRVILSVGRISPIKDYETLIKATDILVNEKRIKDIELLIVGGPVLPSNEAYYKRIKKMVDELELQDYVKFAGTVPQTEVHGYYQQCDLSANMCQTGGVDKAVLEAMACGKPVIVCNEAFKGVLGGYAELLMFKEREPHDLARKIEFVLGMDKDQRNQLCSSLREIVEKEHNVDSLMDKLVQVFADV